MVAPGSSRLHRTHAVPAVALALALTLAGCSRGPEGHRNAEPPATTPVPGGEALNQPVPEAAARTPLVDQRGRRLTLRSLRGRVVVLAPMLTICQETCPLTSASLHRAAQDAERSGLSSHVVFLEVTVDPDRDTVDRLSAYTRMYGELPDWRTATGRPSEVKALWKALGVFTDKAPSDEPVRDWWTGRLVAHPYDVHHQDIVMVIDAHGRLRWVTIGRPDARGYRLPDALATFLNDEGHRNLTRPGADGADSWTAQDVERGVAYVRSLDAGS
jgi:cytochrome oxidase Cu insertion factor (SCO1/SenC/PrrC family)